MIVYLQRCLWLFGLVLLQALVLNHVHIYGYATPVLYIYFILKCNSGMSRNELMGWGITIGLLVDMFSNTPGVNASITTFLAFIRNPLLRMFTLRDLSDAFEPSMKSMGEFSYIKYICIAVFVHIVLLLLVDSFSLVHSFDLFVKVLSDTVASVICILCGDSIRRNRRSGERL